MEKTAGQIDWSGVEPDRSPIGPLDDQTFVVRLRRLSERAESLTILRKAFTEQQPQAPRLVSCPTHLLMSLVQLSPGALVRC